MKTGYETCHVQADIFQKGRGGARKVPAHGRIGGCMGELCSEAAFGEAPVRRSVESRFRTVSSRHASEGSKALSSPWGADCSIRIQGLPTGSTSVP